MGVAADADADADAGALAEPPPPDAGVLACVVSISCDVNFEKDPDDEKVVVSYREKSHASAMVLFHCTSLRPSRTYTRADLRRNGLDCPPSLDLPPFSLHHILQSNLALYQTRLHRKQTPQKVRLVHACLLTLPSLSATFIILK